MELIQSFLLGLLQGIAEFLPISSSGHLILARAFLGADLEPGITFEIVVHFGSFMSIIVYYRKMIMELITDFFASLTPTALKEGRMLKNDNARMCLYIVISMIPAMIVGFTLKDAIEELFMNPFFISAMLVVTGCILFSTKFVGDTDKEINGTRALLMGVVQALAIVPGISRSGSTISAGLYSGLNRDAVANFSFLMVLPVLGGAMILEVGEIYESGIEMAAIVSLGVGFFASFVSGYFALSYLIKILKREKFHYFSYYCWAIGIIGMVYFY